MDSTGGTLQLKLFGTFEARLNGNLLPPLRTFKAGMILAYLALQRGREVSYTELAATLWPDSLNPSENLARTLTELRRALGGKSNPYLLARPGHTLCLDLAHTQVDLITVENASNANDLEAIERQLPRYYRPLLEDWYDDWIGGEREACRHIYVRALQALRAAAMALANYVSVRDCLRRLAVADALHEPDWYAMLEALISHQDYEMATQVFEELSGYLRHDGQTISPQISQLYEQIPLNERNRPVRPATPVVMHIGLPSPLTKLIGRELEMRKIEHLLRSGREIEGQLGTRLLTLTGTGGVGKTCLAIHMAHEVADRYSDDAWFVDLATLPDPGLIVQQVASRLAVREVAGERLLDTLLAYLRPRHMLLVLDNCEHLVKACAELAYDLLSACPNLTILATGRQRLGVVGEVIFRVPSLSTPVVADLPHDKDLLSLVMEYEAVQLFVERARAVHPEFRVAGDNIVAIAQLCERLDGMPLAIELAAARVNALSVEDINTRLKDRFQLLNAGSRTAPSRQQTLRGLIDWSYDLLNAQEKKLLSRLSVFSGGCALEAAEAICADRNDRTTAGSETLRGETTLSRLALHPFEVLDVLASLVEKSLVVAEERDGSVRYRLLETIRQYATERLAEKEETETFRRQHADYFRNLAEQAEPELKGPRQAEELMHFDADYDNLRTALTFYLVDEGGVQAGLRLAAISIHFWITRGYVDEGRRWYAAVLARPGADALTPACAASHGSAGHLAWLQSDYSAARYHFERCLAIWQKLKDEVGIAEANVGLGNLAFVQGDYEEARSKFEEILAAKIKTHERNDIALAMNNLGMVAQVLGDYKQARSLFEQCLVIRRELGDRAGFATAKNNLGNVAYALGDHALARSLIEESLTLWRELGDRYRIAGALSGLGFVVNGQGDAVSARSLYAQSLAIWSELGCKNLIAESLGLIAITFAEHGDATTAVRLFGASEALCEIIGAVVSPDLYSEFERGIGAARRRLRDPAFAVAWAKGREAPIEKVVAELIAEFLHK